MSLAALERFTTALTLMFSAYKIVKSLLNSQDVLCEVSNSYDQNCILVSFASGSVVHLKVFGVIYRLSKAHPCTAFILPSTHTHWCDHIQFNMLKKPKMQPSDSQHILEKCVSQASRYTQDISEPRYSRELYFMISG